MSDGNAYDVADGLVVTSLCHLCISSRSLLGVTQCCWRRRSYGGVQWNDKHTKHLNDLSARLCSDRYTTTAAATGLHSYDEQLWRAQVAPGAEEVVWPNLALRHWDKVRLLTTCTAFHVGCTSYRWRSGLRNLSSLFSASTAYRLSAQVCGCASHNTSSGCRNLLVLVSSSECTATRWMALCWWR